MLCQLDMAPKRGPPADRIISLPWDLPSVAEGSGVHLLAPGTGAVSLEMAEGRRWTRIGAALG